MTDIPTKKRLTISITNDAVDELEQLRYLMEKRLSQRLSIAQVMKLLAKDALSEEAKLAVDNTEPLAWAGQSNNS
jgi:vacuolar-type H+-ATPase catalytic subunit A/Vma1